MKALALPHDEALEVALLGSVLMAPKVLGELAGVHGLVADHFYLPKHQRIYRAMVDLARRGDAIDHLTVTAEARSDREAHGLREDDFVRYVESLPHQAGLTAHAATHAAKVVDLAALRAKIHAYRAGIEAAAAGDWQAIAEAESGLITDRQLRRHRSRQDRQQALMDFLDRDGGDIWASPFLKLNEMLAGGHRRGQFTTLAGWASHGKSVLAVQLLDHFRRRYDLRCALYTNEMEAEELDLRSVARDSAIPYWRLMQAKLNDGEHPKFVDAVKQVGSGFELIEAAGMTADEIANDIRRWRWDVVVVDLLNGLPNSSETKDIDENVSTLAQCSRLAKCHIIACQHLNQHRHAGRPYPPEPVAADIRGSGAIYNLSNIVLFVYLKESEADPGEPSSDGLVKVAKARGGLRGALDVNFDGKRMRFLPPAGALTVGELDPTGGKAAA